jgi:hypothetical protein
MCRLVSKLLLADIHVVTTSEICNYYDSIINMLTRSAARHFLLYWQTSLQQQNFTKQVLTNKFSLSLPLPDGTTVQSGPWPLQFKRLQLFISSASCLHLLTPSCSLASWHTASIHLLLHLQMCHYVKHS